MDIDIKILIQLYREEIAKLQNENMVLKAQIIQMEQDAKNQKVEFQEGDE